VGAGAVYVVQGWHLTGRVKRAVILVLYVSSITLS